MVRGRETKKYEKIDFTCETQVIEQHEEGKKNHFNEWDDTMKTLKLVRPSEFKKIEKLKEIAEIKRKEDIELAAYNAQAKKAGKPPVRQTFNVDEIKIDESETPSIELVDVIAEPNHTVIDGSTKTQVLKTSCLIDKCNYECTTQKMDFKPTLMYATRNYKFAVKNTSLIALEYNFKIANCISGILDAGPYRIVPKQGSINPGCDENFIVRFSPVEVESDFSRILSANIRNLNPALEPLTIELNGSAERPIIHFELPLTTYRERKSKDMAPVDEKLKIIEFDSIGINIRNTNRFMAVNPTS